MRTEIAHVRTFCSWLTAAAIILIGQPAPGNVLFEAGLNGGYTDNLLSDSTALIDRYSAGSAAVRLYPTGTLEVNLTGEATVYDRAPDLSNRLGRVGVNYIPLPARSRFEVFLGGSFDGRRYRSALSGYDLNSLDLRSSIGYRLSDITAVRWGAGLKSYSYLATESGDRQSLETFVGMNTTLPGNHSFDLEVGYGTMDYEHLKPEVRYINFVEPETDLVGAKLKSFYVSPRLSRPLGSRNGLSITGSFRTFMNSDDGVVFGSSVGLLSPWTSVWEGTSVAITLKSYTIPKAITTIGFGYWNRHHLATVESDVFPIVMKRERNDDQIRGFVQLARPVAIGSRLLTPRIVIDYSNSNSSNDLFEYSSFTVSTGFSFRW